MAATVGPISDAERARAGRRALRPDRHIVVVGDAIARPLLGMLAVRISPEAPAPVLRVSQTFAGRVAAPMSRGVSPCWGYG